MWEESGRRLNILSNGMNKQVTASDVKSVEELNLSEQQEGMPLN